MNKSRPSGSTGQDLEMNHGTKTALKQVLLLTMALFFMISPAPDSKDINNMTANFIAPLNNLHISNLKAGD